MLCTHTNMLTLIFFVFIFSTIILCSCTIVGTMTSIRTYNVPYQNYLLFLCWITSNDVHMAISTMCNQHIVHICCVVKRKLPTTSFMDLNFLLLIHFIDKVELAMVFSCHWMLFLERYMTY